MNTSKEFVEYIAYDLLSALDEITFKRLFSGYGIYRHGVIFAIVIGDQLYLKVDDSNIDNFKELDSGPFTFIKNDKEIELPYWSVPEDILDDSSRLLDLVDSSYEVGKRAKK